MRSFSGIRNSMSKSSNVRDHIIYSINHMCNVVGVQGKQRRLIRDVGASSVRLNL